MLFRSIELLIVVGIVGILSSVILGVLGSARVKAYESRTETEFKSLAEALELYVDDWGSYPEDVDRDIPPGLEDYLAPGDWPDAPFPESVYDWDNWSADHLSHSPHEQVVQFSVRFCESSDGTNCNYPDADWAEGFDPHSAAFYCIAGPCRAHSGKAISHPGLLYGRRVPRAL